MNAIPEQHSTRLILPLNYLSTREFQLSQGEGVMKKVVRLLQAYKNQNPRFKEGHSSTVILAFFISLSRNTALVDQIESKAFGTGCSLLPVCFPRLAHPILDQEYIKYLIYPHLKNHEGNRRQVYGAEDFSL